MTITEGAMVPCDRCQKRFPYVSVSPEWATHLGLNWPDIVNGLCPDCEIDRERQLDTWIAARFKQAEDEEMADRAAEELLQEGK